MLVRLITNSKGMLALEMALIMPVMLMFLLTSYDVMRYTLIQRELSLVTSNAIRMLHFSALDMGNISEKMKTAIKDEWRKLGVQQLDPDSISLTVGSPAEFATDRATKNITLTVKLPYQPITAIGFLSDFSDIEVKNILIWSDVKGHQ